MKRWISSLRLHILLPVLVMTLVLVVGMTVMVSRTWIGTNLRQESEKNAAFFDAIAQVISRTVTQSVADSRSIMADDRVAEYARFQDSSDAELIHARVDCRDYLRTEINRHSAIYGLLFMRPDGSLFGALPYNDAENRTIEMSIRVGHYHDFKYSDSNTPVIGDAEPIPENTVIATCISDGECSLEGRKATLTLTAPTLTVYGGEGDANATATVVDGKELCINY